MKNFIFLFLIFESTFLHLSMADIAIDNLYERCTQKKIDINIIKAIVKVESNNNSLAIGINSKNYFISQPKNINEAQLIMQKLIDDKINFDIGLGQINVNNLNWLGLTKENIFDSCANLLAVEKVFVSCLKKSNSSNHQEKINHALSCYNTGSISKGLKNGYVKKVLSQIKNKKIINRMVKNTPNNSNSNSKNVFTRKSKDVFTKKL